MAQDRDINNDWASWLVRRMRARNVSTPTDLARASGVDQSVISRWINEGRTPQVDQLRKIAAPLGSSMIDLLIAAGYVTRQEVGRTDISWTEQIDLRQAIEHSDLVDRAKAHLLNQYELLQEISDDKRRDQRPLRAAARKRPSRDQH